MKIRAMCLAIVSLSLISMVGIGLAYEAEIMIANNSIDSGSTYCEVNTDSLEAAINGNKIIFIHPLDSDDYCTISYSDHSSVSQNGIINMDLTIEDRGSSLTSVKISMTSDGNVIGSTILSGTGGILSGTISGIGPLSNNESLTFSLTLPSDVSFTSNATIDLNFVAYPLSEGN